MDAVSATLSNASRKSPICADLERKVMTSSFPNVAPRNIGNQSRSRSHSMVNLVRFGSTTEGNEVSLSVITDSPRRLGSLKITLLASSVNGESAWTDWRVFRLLVRSILETAGTTIGSLGVKLKTISCKSGHNIGKAATIGATTAAGESDRLNLILMMAVLGERNKGISGMDFPSTDHNSRVFRFGKKGSLMAQSCRIEKTSKDRTRAISLGSLSFRIFRAYFRKRAHSSVVGCRLKDFRIKQLRGGKMCVFGVLTVYPPSFQTSTGKDLSKGTSSSWVSHNASDTGPSKFLQQHASS